MRSLAYEITSQPRSQTSEGQCQLPRKVVSMNMVTTDKGQQGTSSAQILTGGHTSSQVLAAWRSPEWPPPRVLFLQLHQTGAQNLETLECALPFPKLANSFDVRPTSWTGMHTQSPPLADPGLSKRKISRQNPLVSTMDWLQRTTLSVNQGGTGLLGESDSLPKSDSSRNPGIMRQRTTRFNCNQTHTLHHQ